MKLFVTGICGRLGRSLARQAASLQIPVAGVDIVDWPVDAAPVPPGVTVRRGSYEDMSLVEPLLEGCTCVVHAGGPHGANLKTYGFEHYIHMHTCCVMRILEAARRNGATHAVLCSTIQVLIGRDWSANGAGFVDEESPARTDSAYSMSRYMMEWMGKEYARQTGMSIANLRFVAFGREDEARASWRFLAQAIHTDDAASATLAAAGKEGLMGEVFVIGPDTPITAHDIKPALVDPGAVLEKYFPGASAILEANNLQIESSHFWPLAYSGKAKLILNWRPRHTFRQWLLDNGWHDPAARPEAHAAVE